MTIKTKTVKNSYLADYSGKRKHVSQLKPREQAVIWKRLKGVKRWGMASHALDRLVEKGIDATQEDIYSAVHNAEIIEYKIDFNKRFNGYEERVLLRAKDVINGKYNLNAVYSLTNRRVVTVWLNHVADKHRTLDFSLYSADMKVFGV